MKILGYGEDALTLWVLTTRASQVLAELKDPNPPSACTLLFRPSFGRSGGPESSQFGEFDFILASPTCLYLGESKWDQSPEIAQSLIHLREEQTIRHTVFAEYYRIWISTDYREWPAFLAACAKRFAEVGINKPVPPADSLLSQNLRNTLTVISAATGGAPLVRNVLLVIDSRGVVKGASKTSPDGFSLIVINATAAMEGNFIPLGEKKEVEPDFAPYR